MPVGASRFSSAFARRDFQNSISTLKSSASAAATVSTDVTSRSSAVTSFSWTSQYCARSSRSSCFCLPSGSITRIGMTSSLETAFGTLATVSDSSYQFAISKPTAASKRMRPVEAAATQSTIGESASDEVFFPRSGERFCTVGSADAAASCFFFVFALGRARSRDAEN